MPAARPMTFAGRQLAVWYASRGWDDPDATVIPEVLYRWPVRERSRARRARTAQAEPSGSACIRGLQACLGSGTDDDDLFLDDARAAPMPRVPVSAGPVMPFNPDPSRTTWRRADDFALVHHAAREADRGDQRHERKNRILHDSDPTPGRGVAFKGARVRPSLHHAHIVSLDWSRSTHRPTLVFARRSAVSVRVAVGFTRGPRDSGPPSRARPPSGELPTDASGSPER